MKSLFCILMLALWGCMTFAVYAQHYMGALLPGAGIVGIGLHAEPALSIQADYAHRFDGLQLAGNPVGFVAAVNVPLFGTHGLDFDLRLGAGSLLPVVGKFKVVTGVAWSLSRTADLNGKYLSSGLKVDLYPGLYGRRWVGALHFGSHWRPVVHIAHSEYARQAFQDRYPTGASGSFDGPQDGWFRQNAFIQQLGLAVAWRKDTWGMQLHTGFQYIPNKVGLVFLPDVGLMPVYGSLQTFIKVR